jgi:hypothetical protein
MISVKTKANEYMVMEETRLWRAVLAGSIQDWLSKSLRTKHEAESY